MYSCVKVVYPSGGSAPFTETISGINDAATGTPFAVRTMLLLGGNIAADTLGYHGVASSYSAGDSSYHWDWGFMHDAVGGAQGGGICNDFALKIASGADGYGYPFMDTWPDIFFGGYIGGFGYVNNVVAGAFDVTWNRRDRSGDAKIVLCIGGSDYSIDQFDGAVSGTNGVSDVPQGLIQIPVKVTTLGAGSALTGAGGTGFGVGWDTRDGARARTTQESDSQGGNSREYWIDRFDYGGGYVSAWGTSDYTVASGGGAGGRQVVWCGEGIVVKAGHFTIPAVDGDVTFDLGCNAKAVIFQTVGLTLAQAASSDTSAAAICCGFVDPALSQASYFTGDTTNGNVALKGARWLSSSSIARTALADGASTVFANIAEVTSLDVSGAITVTVTDTDGTTPEVIWLAIGRAAGEVPPATPPVVYENPCDILEPKIFAKLTTETDTLKYGIQPLRDSAALGGYAEPRLYDISPIIKVASDPSTGAWSAQTCTVKWPDTDRVNRARSETRTSFRGCAEEIYITSNAQRLAGLPPRTLFAGTVYQDSADENLVLSHVINDLIGSDYAIFGDEKQIPIRTVELNWFPGAPDQSLGEAEPIIGGRRAVLNPAYWANEDGDFIEGTSKGVYVGVVRINGSHGTPSGTDLTSIVAAMNVSGAAGTIYADWGSRIGYGDAIALQSYYDGHSGVPSDYDGLAQIIGYSDLDALLAVEAYTGGDTFDAVVWASHAISEVLDAANGDPSLWIGDTQIPAADIGSTVWCPQIPGDTSWASDIGSDLFTDIVGADGVTRRYTLVLFDSGSSYATDLRGGAVFHGDVIGIEDEGDGTGDAITDYFELYRHVLINFILQDYQSGAWLPSPQFLFSDGVTLIDRVASDTFDDASDVAALSIVGGLKGSFTIDQRASVRDIVARFNFCGGCLLAQDDFGRLIVKVLDTRRENFLTNRYTGEQHRTLRDKVDILPGMRIDAKPDWQTNKITYQYAYHGYRGAYERDAGGGGNSVFVEDTTSQDRDGVITKTVEFPFLADDLTAEAVATYYLDLFKDLPRVVTYTRRGLCGLEDDLLDGVPMTHFNGYGVNGWRDHAIWIIGKTFDPKRLVCTFQALDVEARMAAGEVSSRAGLVLDPVGRKYLISDATGAYLVADGMPATDPVTGEPVYNPGSPGDPSEGGEIPVVPDAPGGYGIWTRAAYAGWTTPVVVRVTNLNDSGIGSLRYALEDVTVPRVVIFEISGYIDLARRITISSPYVTIAAHTAPSPGISLRRYGIDCTTHDVLLQHFRIRPGEWGQGVEDNCCFIAYGTDAHDIVLDHMSASWGPDENIAADKYGSSVPMNMTVYRCISAEGLDRPPSVPLSDGHGMLVQAQSTNVAMIQSLFASNRQRNPYFQGDTSGALVNCVLYNWFANWGLFASNYNINGSELVAGGPWRISAVNNVFIPGPNTDDDGGSPQGWQFYYDHAPAGVGIVADNQIYRSGNLLTNPLGIAMTTEGNELVYDPNVSAPPAGAAIADITVLSTTGLEALVLANAGARPADRDAVDTRIVAYVAGRTTTSATYPVTQTDVGGYPALAVNTRALSIPADPHGDSGNGYTNLEVWLQSYAAAVE